MTLTERIRDALLRVLGYQGYNGDTAARRLRVMDAGERTAREVNGRLDRLEGRVDRLEGIDVEADLIARSIKRRRQG